jgi:sugar lactone lactonase YvrE
MVFAVVGGVGAGDGGVSFDADTWVLDDARIVEHLGRMALMGTAYLKDVVFQNGVIEVDIAVNGKRSYPGIIFRRQSEDHYERFYVRPHRAGLYPDALQYTPVFNGIAGWQLYHGEGFTAGGNVPANQWVHLKLEVAGSQARLYVDQAQEPVLVMTDLKHGVSKGTIGVLGPRNGTAYFSNFSFRHDDGQEFSQAVTVEPPPGVYSDWQISQTLKLSKDDMELYPSASETKAFSWLKIQAEPSGLVDLARFVGRTPGGPDLVLARTEIQSEETMIKQLRFGYSDAVTVFLNGELLFSGNSAYRSRDSSFLGVVGFFDSVYLPLKPGKNELMLKVAESFGGWGFLCQDGDAVYRVESLTKAWETEKELAFPETVVYDAKRDVFYVSNFDGYNMSQTSAGQSVSRLSADGTNLEVAWTRDLINPTGMAIYEDRLFIVERGRLAEVDLARDQLVARHPVEGTRFLNDIAIDNNGDIYVSDSAGHTIYRLTQGEFELWLHGAELRNPNALCVYKGELLVGNNGDRSLKAISLENKSVRTIARFGPGVLDGIKADGQGNFLVAQNEGRLYRVTPSGAVTKLLDTSVQGTFSANFEYVAEKGLIVIPTFYNNHLVAYKLGQR